jgi:hypothetical protein
MRAWTAALLLAAVPARALDVPVGAVGAEAELVLENLQHQTQRGMTFTNDGVGKLWTYDASSGRRTPDRGQIGETLFFTAGARPTENIYADAQLSWVGNYADAFWRPINDLHRQELQREQLRFRRGEAGWTSDKLRLRLLQGKAYDDWRDKGDLFRLVPRQYETERYLNFDGHAVPRVLDGEWKSPWGEFGLIAGPEPVWGADGGVMARYRRLFGETALSYIYKDEDVPYGEADERSQSMSLALSGRAGPWSYDAGLLYQPFRLNRPFQRAEDAPAGQGSFGSRHTLVDDVTRGQDAWGATFRLRRPLEPVFDRGEIGYTVRRPVAGNLEEAYVEGERRLVPTLSTLVNYTYRRPLIDALPLVYAGTPSSPGALLINPRGPESPFWVFWRPEGAVTDNREAHLFTFTAVHDPTPKTWIFKNDAYVVAPDNVADGEDAPFAVAAQYGLEYYPGSTDRSFYHDKDGRVLWEPAYHTGNWPTRRPLHKGTLMVVAQGWSWASETYLQAGQSLALANAAYRSPTDGFKPVTSFFSATEVVVLGPVRASASLGINVWGPEELNQRFGQTFDRLLRLGVEYFLPWRNRIEISYTRARETDQKYLAQDLGGFDEWRFAFVQKFSVLGRLRPVAGGDRDVLPEAAPEKPVEAPASPDSLEISVQAPQVFHVRAGAALPVRFTTNRPRQVTQWSLEVLTSDGSKSLRSYSGFIVPEEVNWNGLDVDGAPAPEGDYRLRFTVSDGKEGVVSEAKVRLTRLAVDVWNDPKGQTFFSIPTKDLIDEKGAWREGADLHLSGVAEALKAQPSLRARIDVYGEPGPKGKPDRAASLAVARAAAKRLAALGVKNLSRVRLAGWGEKRPEVAARSAESLDRRLEITLLPEGKP